MNSSFLYAVGTGLKSCQPTLAAQIAAALGRDVEELFVPDSPRAGSVTEAALEVFVPHHHDGVGTEWDVQFGELICPACALQALLDAGSNEQPWVFGWRMQRGDGVALARDMSEQAEVRRVAKSLQSRWSLTAVRLGMATSVLTDLADLPLIDVWRLTMCASNTWLGWVRDRAFELVSWHGGFRASEVTALDCADLEPVFRDKDRAVAALICDLSRSKTDQDGEGARVAVVRATDPALCPVRAVLTWVHAVNLHSGPVFVQLSGHTGSLSSARARDGLEAELGRSGRGMVKWTLDRLCDRAGLVRPDWGSHSMRSGYISTGLTEGATDVKLMAKTRHTSPDTVNSYAQADKARGQRAARKVLS